MDALLKKLQYRGGPVAVVGAPEEVAPSLGAWRRDGVEVLDALPPKATFALVFVQSCAEIAKLVPKVTARLAEDDPLLWFACPKKSSKRYASDVGRDDSWQPLGDLRFEPVRQVAIDADWSALRFRRVADIRQMRRAPENAISVRGKARVTGNPPEPG